MVQPRAAVRHVDALQDPQSAPDDGRVGEDEDLPALRLRMRFDHLAEPLYLVVVHVDLVGRVGGVPEPHRRQAQQEGSFPDPPGKTGGVLLEAIHPSLKVALIGVEFVESLEVVVALSFV